MLVFRDDAGNRTASAHSLVSDLRDSLARGSTFEALLRAAELECALSDREDPAAATAVRITNHLAAGMLSPELHSLIDSLPQEGALKVTAPEGFAYYGVHPHAYAQRAAEITTDRVGVIGIRSIGCALSGVVAARLGAPRFTVRPHGHPFDRETRFNSTQSKLVSGWRDEGRTVVVVDEGPGLSGSSFLSVGDALVDAGFAREKIIFLCSHSPDPQKLCARNAAERWRGFRSVVVDSTPFAPADGTDFPQHDWRALYWPAREHWPTSWTQMSPRKFLSCDHQWIYKFEGYGHYGEVLRQRAELLYTAGFAPEARADEHGFNAYSWVNGRPLHASDRSPEMLRHLAAYLAFRAESFACDPSDPEPLQRMARFNHEQMLSDSLPDDFRLEVALPTICDARMMPYEWLRAPDGRLMKIDAVAHGDNHFFPGPCDIAWDLAGTIVEWALSAAEQQVFLSHYRALSGDDPTERLSNYSVAYCAFQAGYAHMAAEAMRGTDEELRLRRDCKRYRDMLARNISVAA